MLGDLPLPVTLQDIHALDPETSDRVENKLAYLKDTFGKASVEAYFTESSEAGGIEVSVSSIRASSNADGLAMDIPEGYGQVQVVYHSRVRLVSLSEDSFRIELVRDGIPYRFDLPVSGLTMPMTVNECEGKAVLRLSAIQIEEPAIKRVKEGKLPDPARSDGGAVGLLFLK